MSRFRSRKSSLRKSHTLTLGRVVLMPIASVLRNNEVIVLVALVRTLNSISFSFYETVIERCNVMELSATRFRWSNCERNCTENSTRPHQQGNLAATPVSRSMSHHVQFLKKRPPAHSSIQISEQTKVYIYFALLFFKKTTQYSAHLTVARLL